MQDIYNIVLVVASKFPPEDFPSGPVAENLPANAGRHGPRRSSHARATEIVFHNY